MDPVTVSTQVTPDSTSYEVGESHLSEYHLSYAGPGCTSLRALIAMKYILLKLLSHAPSANYFSGLVQELP